MATTPSVADLRYAAQSTTTTNPSRAQVRTLTVTARIGDPPTLTRDSIGRLTVSWPHPTFRSTITIAAELLEQIVDDLNELALRRLADNRKDDL